MINGMKSSSSPLDVLPTRFLKEVSAFLSSDTLATFNKPLSSGVIPPVFKSAVVQALMKKPNLDTDKLNNFRPVSKVLEKVVYSHILYE